MNKYDWLCNGIRLMGLYWLVSGLCSLPQGIHLSSMMSQLQVNDAFRMPWLGPILQVLIGVVLFLNSPAVVRWIAGRDTGPWVERPEGAPGSRSGSDR